MNRATLITIRDTTLRRLGRGGAGTPRITVGLGSSGVAAGAGKLLSLARDQLAGTGVEVVPGGGWGLTGREPMIEVRVPGRKPVVYADVTGERLERIILEHVIGQRPVREWAFCVVDTGEPVKSCHVELEVLN